MQPKPAIVKTEELTSEFDMEYFDLGMAGSDGDEEEEGENDVWGLALAESTFRADGDGASRALTSELGRLSVSGLSGVGIECKIKNMSIHY